MIPKNLSIALKNKWYSEFVEEVSKLGIIDRAILQSKKGVVEMLRIEVYAEPDEAAYAYMVLQKKEQKRLKETAPSVTSQGQDLKDLQDALVAYDIWFEMFYSALGSDVCQELKKIINDSLHICHGPGRPEGAKTLLADGIGRVTAIAEQALIDGDNAMSNAVYEISCLLDEMRCSYEERLFSAYIDELLTEI